MRARLVRGRAMKERVILTGFEPFADFQVNPSWEAAKALDGQKAGSFQVKSLQIPLRYREIKRAIEGIIDSQSPAIVVSLGQSYRPVISVEKVALNIADLGEATVLYNCGTRPIAEILEPKAPGAYFTTLPAQMILSELRRNSVPAEISYHAGTFGCNQLFFHMMHKIIGDGLDTLGGFIHVPCLPSQAVQLQEARRRTVPCMELERIVEAIRIAVKTTIDSMG
jgi:pyroglutamyl-peptidase